MYYQYKPIATAAAANSIPKMMRQSMGKLLLLHLLHAGYRIRCVIGTNTSTTVLSNKPNHAAGTLNPPFKPDWR